MAEVQQIRAKRFRFDNQTDLVLARTVSMLGAHISNYGKIEKKLEGVLAAFCSHQLVLEKISLELPTPMLSTLRERYNELISNRRAASKKEIAFSGIAENRGELEVTLDNIIEEIVEKKAIEIAKKKLQSDCCVLVHGSRWSMGL